MKGLKEIHQNILNLSHNLLVQVLLYGDVKYSLIDNCRLLNALIEYVFDAEVFKGPLYDFLVFAPLQI